MHHIVIIGLEKSLIEEMLYLICIVLLSILNCHTHVYYLTTKR